MTYRPDVDGLRAIAVLAVVFYHLVPETVSGGYVGVDIFFVISGYLITSILRRELAAGTFTFKGFYERRARRILPALFVMLAVTGVVAHLLLLPSDLAQTLRTATGAGLFSSNVVLWRELKRGYFAGDASLNPLLHTWSLGVEEQFYLLFPILLLLTRRAGVLILLGALSLIASVALLESRSVAVFFLAPFRAWELMVGALLTYLPAITSRWKLEALATLGLAGVAVPIFAYSPSTAFPGLAALPPVLGAAALIASERAIVARWLSLKPMVAVGLISYSLYLWHWPVFAFARYLGRDDHMLALLAASVVLAVLSYRFVERPLRHLRSPLVLPVSGLATLLVVAAVLPGVLLKGYEARFPQEVVALDRARKPVIPYVACDKRKVADGCRLGAGGAPTVLVWGDSHALSWAPALHEALKSLNASAALSTVSACPPIYGALSRNHLCSDRNEGVKAFLARESAIRTVVLTGYWRTYAGQEQKLQETVAALKGTGKHVIVLGPVPVHKANVPFGLALERHQGRQIIPVTQASDQRALHAGFYSVTFGAEMADPIDWMCRPECLTFANGVPLYNDSHHLSVAGAMFLKDHLVEVLKPALRAPHGDL